MAYKLIAILFILSVMAGLAFAQQSGPFKLSTCAATATCCMVPAPVATVPVPGGSPTVVVQGPVTLYGVHTTNQNASSVFMQLFPATAQPAAGSTPLGASSWMVGSSSDRDLAIGEERGLQFSPGAEACCSSTQGTFTAVGNCGFLLEYY